MLERSYRRREIVTLIPFLVVLSDAGINDINEVTYGDLELHGLLDGLIAARVFWPRPECGRQSF